MDAVSNRRGESISARSPGRPRSPNLRGDSSRSKTPVGKPSGRPTSNPRGSRGGRSKSPVPRSITSQSPGRRQRPASKSPSPKTLTQRTRSASRKSKTSPVYNELLVAPIKESDVALKTASRVDQHIEYEFGGVPGVIGFMLFSHCLIYYFWICISKHEGKLITPESFDKIPEFLTNIWNIFLNEALPTKFSVFCYTGFLLFQTLLAAYCPGVLVKGLPIPSENNRRLEYNCNAVCSWYITLFLVAVLHFTGYLPLNWVFDEYANFLTTAVIFGNTMSIVIYLSAFYAGTTHRMTGNHIYDFFMGSWLNPRLGSIDLKMWAEIRISWMLLFILTLSAAAKQYQEYGYLSTSMIFMLVAHFLYSNACMKGEECIPTTWDIFYEKWGWMLIFWNFAGVPFVYCFQPIYLAFQKPFDFPHPLITIGLFTFLFAAYYVWDTANSQKNRFRMEINGSYVKRYAFPQLPWGKLENPKYLKTEHGNLLLIDGWWKYARKIHYAVDLCMSLSWGLSTGFSSFIPYFYFFFFLSHLTHRVLRDNERCSKKYGKDWEIYCQTVPYTFIPYVF